MNGGGSSHQQNQHNQTYKFSDNHNRTYNQRSQQYPENQFKNFDSSRQITYKEYLRDCNIYKDFKDLNLNQFHIGQLLEAKKPKSQLCNLNFQKYHQCIFGQFCQFAHRIQDVVELISEVENKKVNQSKKKLFHNLGLGPSLVILSYFSPEEIVMNLRRVNKEALVLCKRVYSTRKVKLEKISLKYVKLFERAQEIIISKESINFFNQYKDEFYEEILNHYNNVKILTINLNFLFDENQKDLIIQKISSFQLKKNIKTFQAEDIPILNQRNLDNLLNLNFLKNIQYLRLPKNNLGNDGVRYIFSSENLRHIKKIDISSNNIESDGAQSIAMSTNLPYLEVIDLRLNKIGDMGFKFLIRSETLNNLRDLRVDMNKITQTGAVQLSHQCNIQSLKKLKVRDNNFGELGTQFITTTYAMRSLIHLNLSRNQIGDKGALFISEASYMSNLTVLLLDDNELGPQAAQYLAFSQYIQNLTKLSFKNNKISNQGFHYLLISDNFQQMKHLDVEYNQISEEGMISLTDSKYFNGLHHFDISQNEIGNVGAQILSTCLMRNLRYMNLQNNNIGDSGYKCLSESENIPLLQTLKIYRGNNASMEAKKSLMRSKFLRSLNNVE